MLCSETIKTIGTGLPEAFFSLRIVSTAYLAVTATCHQNAAAVAESKASSGRYHDTPRLSPVHPDAARAAKSANELRMAGDRPPDQLQFQALPQRGQGIPTPGNGP